MTRPTWVLLRGLTRASAHWAQFVPAFEVALGVRVITLDLPGNGSLWQDSSPTTVAGMLQCYRQALQTRGITQPFGLLAMSLGGMVAAEWAAQWPQDLSALVLVSTSMRPVSPPWQRLRPAALARLLMLACSRASAQRWEQEILRLTSNHPLHAVLDAWVAERVQHPVTGRNAALQLLAAARYLASPARPAVPTLVLAGEGDRLVSVQCAKDLATYWGTDLCLHPTAGHDLTLDAGPWLAEQVRRWQTKALATRGGGQQGLVVLATPGYGRSVKL
jgi:pimeloyl-ACP methyl ester carboxylesterase